MKKLTKKQCYYVLLFFIIIIIFNLIHNSVSASLCDPFRGVDVINNIWEDTEWTKEKSPYCIADNIHILNAKLTINPGVEVRFIKGNINNQNEIFSLVIGDNGKIIARGSEKEKIVFTSNESNPKLGDWDAIKFISSFTPPKTSDDGTYIDGSIFENVIFKYAKGSNGTISSETLPILLNNLTFYEVEIGLRNSNQKEFSNINFVNCKTNGVLFSGYTPQLLNNVNFINCESGGILGFSFGNENETLTITNSIFREVKSESKYEGIVTPWNYNLYIKNCLFQNVSGDAILNLRKSSIYIEDTEFTNITNNVIETNESENININNCIFDNNLRAINCDYTNKCGTLNIENSMIKNSREKGITGFNKIIINNSSIINNGNEYNMYPEDAMIRTEELTITNSLLFKNNRSLIIKKCGLIENSTIAYNKYYGIQNNGKLNILNSNIFGNTTYDLINYSPMDVTATNNYWGTSNFQTIKLKIYDKNDRDEYGLVNYYPLLNDFVNNTPIIPPYCDISAEYIDFGYTSANEESLLEEVIISNTTITDLIIEDNIIVPSPYKIFHFCSNQTFKQGDNCQFELSFTPLQKDRFVNKLFIPSNSIIQKNIVLTGYSRIDEGFESGNLLKYNWKEDGKWCIQSDTVHSGSLSVQSPLSITDNQLSYLSLTITTGEGLLSFYYKVKNIGYLVFFLDEKAIFQSHETDWTLHTESLKKGIHKLKWKFDSYQMSNDAYFYLDTIIFPKEVTSESQLIAITPENLNFEQHTINTSVIKTIQIENHNENILLINNISFQTNTDSFDIINDSCSNQNLSKQEKCTFNIVFKPIEIDMFSEIVKVVYNDNKSKEINITGEGIGVDVLLSGKVIFFFENYLELPIKNANIFINELGVSCLTDHEGIFNIQLSNIVPKTYIMDISSIDFNKSIDIDINHATNGVIDIGNIEMKCSNKKITLKKILQELKVLSGIKER